MRGEFWDSPGIFLWFEFRIMCLLSLTIYEVLVKIKIESDSLNHPSLLDDSTYPEVGHLYLYNSLRPH